MDTFFDSNPGFKSRVPFTFRFEDISGSLIALRVVEFKGFFLKETSKNCGFLKETAAERQISMNLWVVPPPSKSHHQDYYIFSRESL